MARAFKATLGSRCFAMAPTTAASGRIAMTHQHELHPQQSMALSVIRYCAMAAGA